LIAELETLDEAMVPIGDARKALLAIRRKAADQDKLMLKLTATGLGVSRDTVSGIVATTKLIPRGAKGRPWCQLVLTSAAIDKLEAEVA
jgi:hypothetical protein